jgi:hypothetical protein
MITSKDSNNTTNKREEKIMANIKIVGRKYGTEKRFADWDKEKKWREYDKLDEIELTVDFPNVRAAEKWFAENYPDYYMGCNIRNLDNGEFCMNPVPAYWEEELGTDNREWIIKYILEHFLKTE